MLILFITAIRIANEGSRSPMKLSMFAVFYRCQFLQLTKTGEYKMGRKSVFIRAYRRFRYGEWEDVCSHYRSMPR